MLVAFVLFGGSSGYKVSAVFENGGQLVKGNQVHVGGRAVGTVDSIELNDSSQAVVKMTVTDDELCAAARGHEGHDPGDVAVGDRQPLRRAHAGARTTRRRSTRAGSIDGRRDLGAGRPRPALQHARPGHARRPAEVHHRARPTSTTGKSAKAAEALKYLSPALNTTSRLTKELIADDAVFERFLIDTSKAVGALAERRDELTQLVGNANTAFGAIGDENESLSRALGLLPTTLRKANTTFVNLRAALDDVDKLVAESKPNTKELAHVLRAG